jgi:imidazolonepropionase-like amidohydrolase
MIRTSVCGLMLACAALAQAAAEPSRTALVGGMLLDGSGQPPVHHAAVLIEGARIVAAGPSSEVKIPPGTRIIDTSGRTMMPGMIELHAHLIALGHGDYVRWFQWLEQHKDRYPLEKIMEISAHQLLVSGITSALDLGAPLKESLSIRDRIGRGEVQGPRLSVSGPWIAPKEFLFPRTTMVVGSSAREAALAADQLIHAGVDVIKTQGGLTAEQYQAVADVAHAHGRKVHAHINDEHAIWDALKAGIDVLHHVGSAANPPYSAALVSAIVEQQRAIVPTAARSGIYPVTVRFPERLQDPVLRALMPADIWAELQASFQHFETLGYFHDMDRADQYREASLKQWINSGALIGIGTDNGVPMNFHTDAACRTRA